MKADPGNAEPQLGAKTAHAKLGFGALSLPPGYKQTEVGVIPEEWEVSAVADLVDPTSPICYGVVQVGKYIESGVPVVAIKFVKEIAYAPLHRTACSLEKPYVRSRPKGGDVLISIKGTIGRVGIVPHGFEGNITRELARLRISEETCSEYIAHQLESDATQDRIMRSVVGTTRLEFSIATLRQFQLSIPPTLPEQRAIAAALSDVDGLLGALDRLIAKKRDLKQAAMQQLLTGQTRLPGFKGEWVVKTLKNIVQSPVTDGPHLTPQFFDDGIPFLSVNNLVGNRIDLTDLRFISQADHEVFSRKCKPRKDDILLGKAASVGKVALVELDIEFNIWSPIALIRVDTDNSPRFVYYQLQGAALIGQITLLTNSSSQGNIGMGDIEKLRLNLPPLPEQTAIASVLSEMDAELAALEQRREKTRALKQGMMQELLTGRTRLVSKATPEVKP